MAMDDIPFALPFIGREEEDAALRVLRSGWLTTGKEALAFEAEFARYFGLERLGARAVNSATAGLHLALEALGIGPGDLVLVPSYTFTATAEVARYLGADVVFVDVKPGGFHLDPAALEATLERLVQGLPPYPDRRGTSAAGGFGPRGKARAVIPVHYGGLPCDMDALLPIAKRYGLKIVEDAAHAFPSRLPDGRWIGTIGDLGVFSFYATKTITTGEGGMVVGYDDALLRRIEVMRSHGIDRSIWNRYSDPRASWYYEVIQPGFKYNMPDLLAAIGRVQLDRAALLLAQREAIARRYDEAFEREAGLLIPPTGPGDARHLYPLRLNPAYGSPEQDAGHLDAGHLDAGHRNAFIAGLKNRGIGVSVHYIPLHIMPYYQKRYGLAPEDFPESLKSFRNVISLPIWPGMGEERVERVIAAVKETLKRGAFPP
ncbi:MAG: DegT/DnrJ/EryC1/StrS aminotransferase family protein [Treponema sp.]|jgi:dTDP-4-amino-4,6-dideoxygalactose transaminase|nr:DegT/DnrJ/EryC1/StrS aminotransferase family protein [Treponema sp.]